jgi:hypothetical protein
MLYSLDLLSLLIAPAKNSGQGQNLFSIVGLEGSLGFKFYERTGHHEACRFSRGAWPSPLNWLPG